MRRLIYVPTIHGAGEMHNSEFFSKFTTERDSKLRDVLWDNIVSGILHLDQDFGKVKMYSEGCTKPLTQSPSATSLADSLPIDFKPIDNKQLELVRALYLAGATPMATENEDLLRLSEETSEVQLNYYRGLRSGDINPIAAKRIIAMLGIRISNYVAQRDQSIAAKIDTTLSESETGVLILGIGHDVRKYLTVPTDFRFLSPALEARWELHQHHEAKEHARRLSLIENHQPSPERIY